MWNAIIKKNKMMKEMETKRTIIEKTLRDGVFPNAKTDITSVIDVIESYLDEYDVTEDDIESSTIRIVSAAIQPKKYFQKEGYDTIYKLYIEDNAEYLKIMAEKVKARRKENTIKNKEARNYIKANGYSR